MITQAEITNIDYSSNECRVRIPLFDTVYDNFPVELTAKIMVQPGLYNGYSIGDIVWVAFDKDKASLPVVIGKLYNDPKTSANENGGALKCVDFVASNSASLPLDTNITGGGILESYNSIRKIYNKLRAIELNYASKEEAELSYTNKEEVESIVSEKTSNCATKTLTRINGTFKFDNQGSFEISKSLFTTGLYIFKYLSVSTVVYLPNDIKESIMVCTIPLIYDITQDPIPGLLIIDGTTSTDNFKISVRSGDRVAEVGRKMIIWKTDLL